MKKRTRVREIILKTIDIVGEAEWSEISAAVKAEFNIKNFLTEVRSPLQELIDQDLICRVNDVHKERYVRV